MMSFSESEQNKISDSSREKLFTKEIENSIFDLRTKYGKITFFLITILLAILVQFLVNEINFKNIKPVISHSNTEICPSSTISSTLPHINQSSYAIYGKSSSEGHLIHVLELLKRLNYKRVSVEDDWNLLWAHDYPFRVLSNKLHNLNEFQKVNHIPGSGYITNKVDLSITDLPFIPKSFELPKDKDLFIKYSQENPSTLFVQKHNQHRHIFITPIQNISFDSNDTFIQEFIDSPYLIDGYKFDIGVYVILTSIDPLRVYIYTGDVLFRFCPIKYYPFDSENVNKYIVGDDYLPIWDLPSLKKYYNELKFSMKDAFDAYVKDQNQDSKIIWEQVEDAIRNVILEKEKHILKIYNRFENKHNFFELMRFDLIIDKNLKVFLMEANMSPNLSSAHFKPNALLYEQILYNMMNLVGIASSINLSILKEKSSEVNSMISDYKNIVVFPELCSKLSCTNSCGEDKCKICKKCLTKANIKILHNAVREHLHKANTKRIFPVPIKNLDNFDFEKETQNLSKQNKMMSFWFYGKCKLDLSWCI